MKKIILTTVLSLAVAFPAFAEFNNRLEGKVLTSYGYKQTTTYTGDATVAIDANTSDNVRVAGSTINISYSIVRSNNVKSRTPYNQRGILDTRIKIAIEEAIDSTFAKYDINYIKKNTQDVFEEVMDTAQGNADFANPGLRINLTKLSFR